MAAKREQNLRLEAEQANAVKDHFLAVYGNYIIDAPLLFLME